MEEKDVAIIIKCDPSPAHIWMSYASWYSIHKNIALSSVYLHSEEKINPFWCHPCKVKILKNQFKIEKSIIKTIDSTVIAARGFEGNLDISSSKSDVFSCLVDYKFGCGDFVLDKWINSIKAPFGNALKIFSNYDLTINEVAILKMWEQCIISYRALGGVC